MDPNKVVADDVQSNAPAPAEGAALSDSRPPTVSRGEGEFVRTNPNVQPLPPPPIPQPNPVAPQVGVLKLRKFVELVERACKAKELAKEKRKAEFESRDSKKRQMGKSFQSSTKKPREFNTRSSVSAGRHLGECWMNSHACFKCGSHDHFTKNCPETVEKEKFQSVRSGNATSRGKPQKNLRNRTSSKSAPREPTVRPKGRAPTRTYAIRAREETSCPDAITDWLIMHDIIVNCRRKIIKLKCESGDILRVKSDE
ncbi:uncharacterized protein [Gossypium hirsutum]|uniref:CCHC-type domain-containing protein n=1 Tax=Gossypium hirsutum TaxID=3635 RepID=A0A1U8P7K5_GOSHI|nr:uncharacterized protein LOC107955830 [Gossypium hirsutum]